MEIKKFHYKKKRCVTEKRSVKFTFLLMMLKSTNFPPTVRNGTWNLGEDFFSVLQLYII